MPLLFRVAWTLGQEVGHSRTSVRYWNPNDAPFVLDLKPLSSFGRTQGTANCSTHTSLNSIRLDALSIYSLANHEIEISFLTQFHRTCQAFTEVLPPFWIADFAD